MDEKIASPRGDVRPKNRLATASLWMGLATLLVGILYAVSGKELLLELSLAGTILSIITALIGAGVVVVRGFRCRGLGHALAGGCLGLLIPILAVGFG